VSTSQVSDIGTVTRFPSLRTLTLGAAQWTEFLAVRPRYGRADR
jgi:hypothetical protein